MILGIYGAGGLGKEVLELAQLINEETKQWNEFIFIDDNKNSNYFKKYKVLTFDEAMKEFGNDEIEFSIAIGDPKTRALIFKKIKDKKFQIITLIHPTAIISDTAVIEEGVIIAGHAIVSVDAIVKEGSILIFRTIIGHDCVIGEFSTFFMNVMVAGNVSIGKECSLGSGSFILQEKNLCDNVKLAPLSAVYKDITEEGLYSGNPARRIRE